ncbi:TPA: hypothetical protein ACIJ2E_000052 [Klebsiella pneumoniae]|uniref:hypothetical protein n=1 Tax=Klebsiella TaxID=570 RepID=UPI000E3EB355|nr:hypothetical protein [Klebsiella pneumoniae]EKZ5276567.1 hypothetical protein [Klebsiella pneumoniae]HCA7583279.1 hypothetical protein [Klebsiella pneumoniae]
MSEPLQKDIPLDFPEHRIVRRDPNNGGGGGGMSDNLERRVERLETDLSVVRVDLAILKERSENFATKAELATLIERSENFATKADLEKAIGSVGNKITWSIFVPLLIAVLGWLAKELFFK